MAPRVASGDRNRTVCLWDTATWFCVARARTLSAVCELAFLRDGGLGAADDGAATANRPVPYTFVVESGPYPQ